MAVLCAPQAAPTCYPRATTDSYARKQRDTAGRKQHVKEAGGEAASVSGAVKGPLFGLDLNAEEKMARIAFLKTL
jgi:3'-phosphoadenosine 5'-phosphosulfate (PAPS) 3'-phosphatase